MGGYDVCYCFNMGLAIQRTQGHNLIRSLWLKPDGESCSVLWCGEGFAVSDTIGWILSL